MRRHRGRSKGQNRPLDWRSIMLETDTTEDIEALRLQRLADCASERATTADRLAAQFCPGSHGCHEALHAASIFMEMVDRRLCDHPAVLANPDWYALAHRAMEYLFQLYQSIGSVHLTQETTDRD
jgi:hypothetical protein